MIGPSADKVSYVCDGDDRPSWTHYPDGFTWADASWGDRARVVAVVLGIIVVGLAGSVR